MFKNSTFHPSKRTKVIASVVGVILIAVIAIGTIYLVEYENVVNKVKSDLIKVGNAMETTKSQTKAYPLAIPASSIPSDGVALSGGGSFDGVSYCVTGTSQYSNKPVVFHVDSTTNSQGPQPNSCANALDVTPSAPTGLVIDSMNTDSLTISWTASIGARAYALQCATNTQFTSDIVNVRVTNVTGTCSNLKSSTLYYVRVKGLNSTKGGEWSVPVSMTTAVLSVVPTNFKATPISSTQVSYSWNSVAGASSYTLQQSTDVNFVGNLINTNLTGTSGIVSNLKPNTTYFYHVEAVTPGFNTLTAAYSNELIVTTLK